MILHHFFFASIDILTLSMDAPTLAFAFPKTPFKIETPQMQEHRCLKASQLSNNLNNKTFINSYHRFVALRICALSCCWL